MDPNYNDMIARATLAEREAETIDYLLRAEARAADQDRHPEPRVHLPHPHFQWFGGFHTHRHA